MVEQLSGDHDRIFPTTGVSEQLGNSHYHQFLANKFLQDRRAESGIKMPVVERSVGWGTNQDATGGNPAAHWATFGAEAMSAVRAVCAPTRDHVVVSCGFYGIVRPAREAYR